MAESTFRTIPLPVCNDWNRTHRASSAADDDTRVRLSNTTGDYINANHVKLDVDGTEYSYIASQGPKQVRARAWYGLLCFLTSAIQHFTARNSTVTSAPLHPMCRCCNVPDARRALY